MLTVIAATVHGRDWANSKRDRQSLSQGTVAVNEAYRILLITNQSSISISFQENTGVKISECGLV